MTAPEGKTAMSQPHHTVAELAAARTQLVLHRLDPAARCCSACGADCDRDVRIVTGSRADIRWPWRMS